MRTYYANDHRVLAGGAVEIEGRWKRGVQTVAILMLVLLPFVRRIPGVPVAMLALGVYLLAFPPRRRVTFDPAARAIRVDHKGLFGERWSRTLALARVREVVFDDSGAEERPPGVRLIARTEAGPTYLVTFDDARSAARVEARVRPMLG